MREIFINRDLKKKRTGNTTLKIPYVVREDNILYVMDLGRSFKIDLATRSFMIKKKG